MRRIAALLAAVALLGAMPALASLDGVERLRDEALRHPDDPDLAWALARSLADAERDGEAITALEELLRRWPDRLDARLRLGALLVADGRSVDAFPHLRRAVALAPASGPARLQLGLALDALGRHDEAEREWRLAARVAPGVRAESLLLRGIARLERGDEAAAVRLLEEAIELDPLGDVADAARLLLATADRGSRPRLRLQAYGGIDYDSNVTLDSGSTPGLSSDRDDVAGVWGALLAGDLLAGARHKFTAGARYHERNYLDLHAFDERTFLGFLSGELRSRGRLAWRLSAMGSHVMLGDDSYLTQVKLHPNLLVWAGESLGVVQIAANVAGHLYEDDPLFSSLERDAVAFGAELHHFFPVPCFESARGSWGFEYERVVTDAERDALGFEGDYDHHRYAGRVDADVPLFFSVRGELGVGVAGEIFEHDNLVDFLAQVDAGGTVRARRRRDVVLDTSVGLVRPLHDYVDLELRWRYQQRFSNTDVFSYERHVVGAMLRVKTF